MKRRIDFNYVINAHTSRMVFSWIKSSSPVSRRVLFGTKLGIVLYISSPAQCNSFVGRGKVLNEFKGAEVFAVLVELSASLIC